MDTLFRNRHRYIQESIGDVDRVDHVVHVLFTRGAIQGKEMENITGNQGPGAMTRALINLAIWKDDATSVMLATAWDNYAHGLPATDRPYTASDDSAMSHKAILNIMEALTHQNIVKLKFYMRFPKVANYQPHTRADLDAMTTRAQIAEAIALLYGDKAGVVLTALLKNIGCNGLANKIDEGGNLTYASKQSDTGTFVGCGEAINLNLSAVTMKV
ncbi:hypothetical protein DPEC_G00376820 [Dallia pectoralis]|nr:hypothetical protein DPEC_G00376820 [Dallia pectoralis]